MAKKQVDILLNSVFDERGFTKAHKSFADLVRAQRRATIELGQSEAQVSAQAEKADIASLNRRLDAYQKHYARKLDVARRAAPLFADIEQGRLNAEQSKLRGPVLTQIAAQQARDTADLRRKSQALGGESDVFLAARARQEAARATPLGGGGRSQYALTREADRINAGLQGQTIGDMGGVARLFKIGAAAQLTIEAVRLGTHLWNGDLEKAADAVQELPFGIGRAASSIKEIMMEWSGANAEIAIHNKAIAELEERGKRIQAQTSASNQLNAMLVGLRVENIADPFQQELARAKLARDNALAEVDRIQASGGDITGERSAEARRRIQTEFRQQEEDIEHRRAKAKDAEEKVDDDFNKGKLAERMAAAAKLADLDDQIRAKELESMGRHLDAQLLMLRRSYDERIAATESVEEKERLIRLRGLDEAALLAGNQAGPIRRASATVEAVEVSNRFRGLAATARSNEEPAAKLQRTADAALQETRKQTNELRDISRALRERGRGQEITLLPAGL